MKLFIPILSALLPGARPQDGSGDAGDTVVIEGCATVFFPTENISEFTDLQNLCSALLYTGTQYQSSDCYASCSGTGEPSDEYLLDDNSELSSHIANEQIQVAFADEGKDFSCVDICFDITGAQSDVGEDHENHIVGILTDNMIENGIDQSGVSVLHLESETNTESSGDGGGETDPTDEPDTEVVNKYEFCMTMFLPTPWLLSSSISNLDGLCGFFEDALCAPWEAAGAKCHEQSCASTCTGDGIPDIEYTEEDSEATEGYEEKDDEFWDANDNINSLADPLKYACFDFCFSLHASDTHIDEVLASLEINSRFSAADLTGLIDELGEQAAAEAASGQDGDTSTGQTFGTLITSDETGPATGRDCAIDNGLCSHTCSGPGLDGVCACPNDCWELEAVDGLECLIKKDKVTLICESDRMIAHLAKCVVDGSQDFILNDKSCNEGDPTVVNQSPCHAAWNINDTTDDGCVTFHTRLDECGTSVQPDYLANRITFSQTLISSAIPYSQEPGNAVWINRDALVSVDFTCEYKTDYSTAPGSAIVNPNLVSNALESTGQFVFGLETVTHNEEYLQWQVGPAWDVKDSTTEPYQVGNTLFFQICVENPLANIYFSVPDCTVKNAAGTESYKIMDEHNLDVFVNTARVGRQMKGDLYYDWTATDGVELPDGALSQEVSNKCLYFSYTVFEFVSSDANDNLRLTCDVHACNYDENSPDDIVACTTGTSRKRRSAGHDHGDDHHDHPFYRVATSFPIQYTKQVQKNTFKL